MAIGALIGGGIQALGGIIGSAQRNKAQRNYEERLNSQTNKNIVRQGQALDRFGNAIGGVISDAQNVSDLDLSAARGMYGGMVDEARLQQEGLLGAAQRIGSDFMSEQQRLGQQSVQRGQDRLAMSQGGRVAGQEAMMDAVRRGTADATNQVTRVGGSSSDVLSAINQSAHLGGLREQGIEARLGERRQQDIMQARQGLMSAEQRDEQGRLGAMQYAGGLEYGAQQTGGSILMNALGNQAGFEGQATQAEQQAELQKQQYIGGLQSGLAGQMLEGDISQIQMRQDAQNAINQSRFDREGTSLLGAGIGALGQGLIGATQLASYTPQAGRSGFSNFLMGTGGSSQPTNQRSAGVAMGLPKTIGAVKPPKYNG